jgi:hypothetical protein
MTDTEVRANSTQQTAPVDERGHKASEKFRIWCDEMWSATAKNPGAAVVALLVLGVGLINLAGLFGFNLLTKDNLISITGFTVATLALYIHAHTAAVSKMGADIEEFKTTSASLIGNLESAITSTVNGLASTTEGLRDSVDELVTNRSPYTVNGTSIGVELREMLDSANSWKFRGGSGRWQRSHVLPSLASGTKLGSRYEMLILDPSREMLCRDYAEYRTQQRQNTVDGSTHTDLNSIRSELLACVFAVAWYKKRSRVEPSVHLIQSFSPLRQDISPLRAAITTADMTEPGLFVPTKAWYYAALVDEFDQLRKISPQVAFGDLDSLPLLPSELRPDHVQDVLLSASIRNPDNSTADRPLVSSDAVSVIDWSAVLDLAFKEPSR